MFLCRGAVPSPRQEILHNIDPLLRAPLVFDDTVAMADGWTRDLVMFFTNMPYYDDFSTSMQAALRVGDWKILTGTGGAYEKPFMSN